MSLRWRMLRSAAFAVVATALAAIGHMTGGGRPPDAALLLVGAGGVTLICTGLTTRRRSLPEIVGLLAACQLAFHLLFSLDVHRHVDTVTGWTFLPAAPLPMLAVHLVATALSGLVLAKGESALFRLFAVLRRAVMLITSPAAIDVSPSWTPVPATSGVRPTGALLSTSPRRGPPQFR